MCPKAYSACITSNHDFKKMQGQGKCGLVALFLEVGVRTGVVLQFDLSEDHWM